MSQSHVEIARAENQISHNSMTMENPTKGFKCEEGSRLVVTQLKLATVKKERTRGGAIKVAKLNMDDTRGSFS